MQGDVKDIAYIYCYFFSAGLISVAEFLYGMTPNILLPVTKTEAHVIVIYAF
jgi:hypothetical protein